MRLKRVGIGFMENLGFEVFSREGSSRTSGKKVGVSTGCVKCALTSSLSCGD